MLFRNALYVSYTYNGYNGCNGDSAKSEKLGFGPLDLKKNTGGEFVKSPGPERKTGGT